MPTASEYQLQVSTSPYFDAPLRTQGGVGTESCFTTRTTVTPFNGQASAPGRRRRATAPSRCSARGHRCTGGSAPSTTSSDGTSRRRHHPRRRRGHQLPAACRRPGSSTPPPALRRRSRVDSSAPVGGRGPRRRASPSASASPSGSRQRVGQRDPVGHREPVAATPSAPAAAGRCEPAHAVEKGAWSASASFTHRFALARAGSVDFPDLPTPGRPAASERRLPGRGSAATSRPCPGPSVPGRAVVPGLRRAGRRRSPTSTPSWRRRRCAGRRRRSGATAPPAHGLPRRRPGLHRSRPPPTAAAPGATSPSAPLVFRKSSPRLATLGSRDRRCRRRAGGRPVLVVRVRRRSRRRPARPATSEAYAYRVQVDPGRRPRLRRGRLRRRGRRRQHAPRLDEDALPRRRLPVAGAGRSTPAATGCRGRRSRSFTRDGTAPTFTVASAARLRARAPSRCASPSRSPASDARSVTLSGRRWPRWPSRRRPQRDAGAPACRCCPAPRTSSTVTAGVRDRAGNAVAARAVAGARSTRSSTTARRCSMLGGSLAAAGRDATPSPAPGRAACRAPAGPTLGDGRPARPRRRGQGLRRAGATACSRSWVDGKRIVPRRHLPLLQRLRRRARPRRRSRRPACTGCRCAASGPRGPRSRGTAVAVDAVTAVR